MSNQTIDTQLLTDFHALAKSKQLDLLNYLHSLLREGKSENEDLLSLQGSISDADLDRMTRAIEEGCEKVDADEW